MSWLTTNTTASHLVGWNCLHSGKQLNEQKKKKKKKKKETEKKLRGKNSNMVFNPYEPRREIQNADAPHNVNRRMN
jgi:hypothetical protein